MTHIHAPRALALAGVLLTIFGLIPPIYADETVLKLPDYVTLAARDPGAAPVATIAAGLESVRMSTRIEAADLAAFGVTRVEDLSPLVPGAVNVPIYGLIGVPFIRGDLGDTAWNGQRLAYNRNVFPVSFNGVEGVGVLAGAPPAWLGYTNGTGGFINFIAKAARFETERRVQVAVGSWDDFRVQFDATGPVNATLAARVSLERAEAGSFYRGLETDSWSGYLALAWRPRAGVAWDLSAEAYTVNFAENPGINRPTQALIDRGEYVTGSSVQSGGAGSYFGNTFVPTGTVRLDGSQILLAPGDGGWARTAKLQLTGTLAAAEGRTVVSRTYFERVTGEKAAAYAFYSYLPRSLTFEQRVEVREMRTWAGQEHRLCWGAAVRGEERLSFVDFFNEAMNAFDLTLDPETFRLPATQFFGVRPVPGRAGRRALSGARYPVPPTVSISQTLHSWLGNAGAFVQDDIAVRDDLTLSVGARADVVHVTSEDPLPAPGYAPVRDSLKELLPSVNASLTWRVAGPWSVYFTVNRAAAAEPSSGSGGYGLTGNRLSAVLFNNASELIEAGARYAAKDGRYALQASVYRQDRVRTNPRFGLPDEIRVQGCEWAATWRPWPALSLQGNASYVDARYQDGPLPGGIATVPQFDPNLPSDNFPSYPRGNYRLPGLPRWLANLSATWTAPEGWGVRAWGLVQGAQNLDLFGRVVIPAQQTWNGCLFLQRGAWETSLALLNATNAFNWRPTSTPFAGGDLVTRELPRHVRFTVTRRF